MLMAYSCQMSNPGSSSFDAGRSFWREKRDLGRFASTSINSNVQLRLHVDSHRYQ
jgi:hypothetical protein